MFSGMLIILSIGCLVLTVSLYEVFKKSPPPLVWIARLIELNPLIAFAFNFAVSFILTMFIGVGMVAGAANLIASMIFPIYIIGRAGKNRTSGGKSLKNIFQERNTGSRSLTDRAAAKPYEPPAGNSPVKTATSTSDSFAKSENSGQMVGKIIKKGTVTGYKAGKAIVKGGAGFVRGMWRGIRK